MVGPWATFSECTVHLSAAQTAWPEHHRVTLREAWDLRGRVWNHVGLYHPCNTKTQSPWAPLAERGIGTGKNKLKDDCFPKEAWESQGRMIFSVPLKQTRHGEHHSDACVPGSSANVILSHSSVHKKTPNLQSLLEILWGMTCSNRKNSNEAY